MKNIEKLVRKNIMRLKPYSSARDEYSGDTGIFLDANENPHGSGTEENFNRYPDPYQRELKKEISKVKNIDIKNIFAGNGSDEAIDLIIRIFCNPGADNIIIMPPTYGMYSVSASVNDVITKEVKLTTEYELNIEEIFRTIDAYTKIIFICSPNNPTGNSFRNEDIYTIIKRFNGIVVIDEAYIDFNVKNSFLNEIYACNNVVVLHTFSKAWGLAGLRVGMAFADEFIINLMNKVKPPYNVSVINQKLALEAIRNPVFKEYSVENILKERARLTENLKRINIVKKIYPSDSNFLLVRFHFVNELFENLLARKIIVRNRSRVSMCEGCLRITVGTMEENNLLLEAIKSFVIP